jgi:hypothetical protein
MKLDTSILNRALLKLEVQYTFNQITQEAKVHNLRKMVDGKTTPTPDSWWKLHNAFPNDIPEPSYMDGSRVYKNVVSNGATVTTSASQPILTEQELAFILKNRKVGNSVMLDRWMCDLDKLEALIQGL